MGRYTGETVEEAVASASKKLGVAVDQLEVKTIQQPRHGLQRIQLELLFLSIPEWLSWNEPSDPCNFGK